MRRAMLVGVVLIVPLGLLTIAGCGKKSQPGGEPGTRNEFVLRGPTMTTSLKPGESQDVTIAVDRGKDFKEAVKFKIESPKGIEADVNPSSVQANEKGEVHLKLTAHKDSAVGENSIRVVGIPAVGQSTSLDVKVKINPLQDSFRLKTPMLETAIKQGDTQTLSLTLNRDDDFKQAIKFTAEAPKDVHVEVMPSEVQPSDKGEVNLRIRANSTAALGEHNIRVTGTPSAGQPVVTDVKFKVKDPG